MRSLDTQEDFEALWYGKAEEHNLPTGKDGKVLIWFSAKWCGPCQRMDKGDLQAAADLARIPLYYCDYTINDYTAGYCGIKAFPTFLLIKPQKKLAWLSNSDTETVCKWILSSAAAATN